MNAKDTLLEKENLLWLEIPNETIINYDSFPTTLEIYLPTYIYISKVAMN